MKYKSIVNIFELQINLPSLFMSILYVLFLPHAKFSFFGNAPFDAYDIWDTISRSLLAKIIPEHRAYTTYNISKARPKRISSKKVMLIFLWKFIFDTHGTVLRATKLGFHDFRRLEIWTS